MGEVIQPDMSYVATIALRRGTDWNVRPECEEWDGRRVRVSTAFWITADDRPQYDGEWAMFVDEKGWPRGWIASGDLTDIAPAEARKG